MEPIVRAAEVCGARALRHSEPVVPATPAEPGSLPVDEAAMRVEVETELRAALEMKLRAELKREAEVLRAAERRRGYDEGFAAGSEEARRLAEQRAAIQQEANAAQLRKTLDCLHASLADTLRSLEGQIVDLVSIATMRILGDTFVTADAIAAVVRRTLAAAHAAGRFRVRLHPDDLARLAATLDPQELATASQQLEFVADPGLAGGGCVIDTPVGQFDATFDTQLRVLHETLAAARRSVGGNT